jgi:hypothetical protein
LNALRLKAAALAAVAVPLLVLSGCAPECVDIADCADKAAAAGEEYTCVSGKCQPGSPFVLEDAGSSLETDGGETGGGGGATGGGSGGGGGGEADAGTGGGSGGGEADAGTDDAGTGEQDGGTDAGQGTTDAGVLADPTGAYAATLNGAQATGNASTQTGSGTFTVSGLADGGYAFSWMITHTVASGGATNGSIRTGLAGFPGTPWITFANANSPISGSQDITPAQAEEVRAGNTHVSITRMGAELRGQIIPAGNALWTARLNPPTPGATFGGVQFVAPLDGGAVSYLGAWTADVAAQMAHIHQGGPAGTGGVIVPLALTADARGLSGTFDPATLEAGDTDGGLYVNVHTTDAGDGLIRGQLVRH